MPARFLLAQISDTHIRARADSRDDGRGGGRDNVEGLRRAFAAIAEFRADAIIATGDLANDARADEYARLAEALAEAPAPVYLLPGNHDAADLIRAHFPAHAYLPRAGRLNYAVEDYPVRLVALDQTAPGETFGAFTPDLSAWLDETLAQRPGVPTIVALHHPPFASYDLLFDTIALKQAEAFAAIIARHPQVARIICGHHHRAVISQVAHAMAFAAPSTAWTYSLTLDPDEAPAQKTTEPPGWALHVWSAESGLATHVMGF